ncbi:hypothetical protein [Peterkaempfera bronchialis]|uniref:hypothetical protein n=1 Tax=Peterkaempfera bronchialis TaxID=2126346 RepID=UPI0013B3A368|nr:hypothetical protein [Peterkaempfera bronchialis]
MAENTEPTPEEIETGSEDAPEVVAHTADVDDEQGISDVAGWCGVHQEKVN